jgi:hypothetical protein
MEDLISPQGSRTMRFAVIADIVNPGSVGAPGYAAAQPIRRVYQVGSPHAVTPEFRLGRDLPQRPL